MMPDAREHGTRLLYLGFAFPPGVAELFPGLNPAGHALETQLVLLLLDSSSLGQPFRRAKSFRHRFKPMQVSDADMLDCFDACIGLSRTTERYFHPKGIPFLWMPGGCTPNRALSAPEYPDAVEDEAPMRFAYFGASVRPGALGTQRTCATGGKVVHKVCDIKHDYDSAATPQSRNRGARQA